MTTPIYPVVLANKATPTGVLAALDSVVAVITIAQNENRALQALFAVGTPAWQQCETVDDRLHEALTLLG